MKRIVVLNSYTLSNDDAYSMVRIKYFFKGLEAEGYRLGTDLQVELIDSNDPDVISAGLSGLALDTFDLIHAVGTPNAAIAAKLTSEIPIVYYGAHPEGVGVTECRKTNSCGMILNLPFTANYKNFRFLKKLMPNIQRIYVPFYEHTIFCHERMRENYRLYRSRENGKHWLPMDSQYIGYRSLASLSYIIGIEYFEYLYRDIDELSTLIDRVEPEHSLIMPYNDSVFCRDAPGVLLASSHKIGVPLLWNNNPEAAHLGAFAAVAGCFKEAGHTCGSMAGKLLNGAVPADMGYLPSTKSYACINLKTAQRFGMEFPEKVLDYFDEIIA
jgi:ABC-type uncharacterized transport system substrate-binding protein